MVNCEIDVRSLAAAPSNLRSSTRFVSRHLLTALSSVLLLTAAVTVRAADDDAGAPAEAAVNAEEAAAPAEPAGPNPMSSDPVERGHYLALAGNCATCHTVAGGETMAGGLPFKTPFGTLYSTNITPDPDTGIGNWTEEQFANAMRKGVRPDGQHLYPAFPYTAFTKLSDEDVSALYAYMKTVPAVNAPAPANELSFPASQRWAMGIWKMLFFTEGRFTADASKSEEWNRGAYLVDGLGHCSSCHSPRNFLGAEKTDAALTGGEYTDKVASGELRTWSAPNLTSASNGLGSWPLEDLTAYLHTGRNSFTETYGPMNEVIMNSTRHLREADVRAMATYLKDLPANPGNVGSPPSDEVKLAGSNLYDVHCGTCHLPSGMGADTTSLGADNDEGGARLAGNPVIQASNPASLINVILYGPQLPDPPLPKRWKPMEGFGEKLTDEEVAAIASFLRSNWDNKGGAVSASQVAKQR